MTTASNRLSRASDVLVDHLERRFTLTSALVAIFVLNVEIAFLGTYVLVGRQRIVDWMPILLPFVWINVSLVAVGWTRVGPASRRQRTLAVAIAVGYFLLLAWVSGMFGAGIPELPTVVDLKLATIPPGWAPALVANTPTIRLSIVFYQFVGYLALAYLVYATVIDASGSVVNGVVGLFSCVSCTWPVIGSVVTGILGSGTALSAFAYDWTYLLSTVVFVVTVGLLYWRPGIGSLVGDSSE